MLYRFANANLANLNYHYRGTSPHCLHYLAAAEATGLRLQVFKVCFYKSVFFLMSVGSGGDVAERDVQVASPSRGHGLAGD